MFARLAVTMLMAFTIAYCESSTSNLRKTTRVGASLFATTAGRNLQFVSLDANTGVFTKLFDLPSNLYDSFFYQSAVNHKKNLYTFFVSDEDGLRLCNIDLDTYEIAYSPPRGLWSEWEHQPKSIHWSDDGVTLYSVVYWDVPGKKLPRQLFEVKTDTWEYFPIYTWPLSGTDFRGSAYDPRTNSIHMLMVNSAATPRVMYLHSINLTTNATSVVNVTKSPEAIDNPFRILWNPKENLIWCLSQYTTGVGLTKIDPTDGVTRTSPTQIFTSGLGLHTPAPTIDLNTNTWVQCWNNLTDTFILSISSDGELVSKARLATDGFSSMAAV